MFGNRCVESYRFVTVSIDDGHPTDLKTADLLQHFALKGTFYVPAHNPERDMLRNHEIQRLSRDFEIGSHTLTHRSLKYASPDEAMNEIDDGKKWLDDLLGKRTISFCYPNGTFNRKTIILVKRAGFLGARTCMFNLHNFPKNPFLWGVSTHAYSHQPIIQIRHALRERNFRGLLNFGVVHKCEQDWSNHFRCALAFVEKYGGVAHLYLHSWEIEEQNQWGKLQVLLKNIAENKRVVPVTNGDLFQLWHRWHSTGQGGDSRTSPLRRLR